MRDQTPVELAERIKSLSPQDRLRLAAGLLDAAKVTADRGKYLQTLEIAKGVIDTVGLEISAAILVASRAGRSG